ncbi:MAG: hypothetical protein DHS20C19_00040 [Acidimicrobiales bacterium]|nr:MAG: hypothetical protein DHS20C19_00040 [Acidimicrobiales bacterium]
MVSPHPDQSDAVAMDRYTPHTDIASRARSEAAARRLLALHALAFAVVNTANGIADAADGGDWRIHWTLLGWGTGLAIHAAVVLWPRRLLGSWERNQAARIERRLRSETEATR